MEKRLGTSLLVWVALWTVYIVWGSTYIGIRVMDETIPPMIGAATRFLAVGVLLATYLLARRGRSALRVSKRELLSLGVVGTLLLAGGNGVLIYAETWVPAGISALVVASVPLWIVALRLVGRDRPKAATIASTLFGFAGVALLVLAHGGSGGATAGGLLLVVVASVSWALGSYLSSRLPMPRDPLVSTAWETLLAGLVLFVAAVPELGSFHPGSVSIRSATGLAYLVTFGSILGLTAYVWLLQSAPISKVSTYAYVNPVVAILLGALLLGESVTPAILLGGAIIVVAVAAVIMIEGRSPRVRTVEPVAPVPTSRPTVSTSLSAFEPRSSTRRWPARTRCCLSASTRPAYAYPCSAAQRQPAAIPTRRPRFWPNESTSAPAARAASAVPSVEPSSTTSTSASGSSCRSSSSTAGRFSSSFHAGMKTTVSATPAEP